MKTTEDPPQQVGADQLCQFCEALLKLEWPGRRVAVTPAPLPEMVQAEFDVRGVLDVTVGPLLPDDESWVCFRVLVQDEVARRDWIGVGAVLLRRARHDFALWPLAPRAAPSDDQS